MPPDSMRRWTSSTRTKLLQRPSGDRWLVACIMQWSGTRYVLTSLLPLLSSTTSTRQTSYILYPLLLSPCPPTHADPARDEYPGQDVYLIPPPRLVREIAPALPTMDPRTLTRVPRNGTLGDAHGIFSDGHGLAAEEQRVWVRGKGCGAGGTENSKEGKREGREGPGWRISTHARATVRPPPRTRPIRPAPSLSIGVLDWTRLEPPTLLAVLTPR